MWPRFIKRFRALFLLSLLLPSGTMNSFKSCRFNETKAKDKKNVINFHCAFISKSNSKFIISQTARTLTGIENRKSWNCCTNFDWAKSFDFEWRAWMKSEWDSQLFAFRKNLSTKTRQKHVFSISFKFDFKRKNKRKKFLKLSKKSFNPFVVCLNRTKKNHCSVCAIWFAVWWRSLEAVAGCCCLPLKICWIDFYECQSYEISLSRVTSKSCSRYLVSSNEIVYLSVLKIYKILLFLVIAFNKWIE